MPRSLAGLAIGQCPVLISTRLALKPLDRRRVAHIVTARRGATAHPAFLHRVDHPVAQILRIRPPVRSKSMMSLEASDFGWIFVVKQPRRRPSTCPSCPRA
jgi:hypothetical protein